MPVYDIEVYTIILFAFSPNRRRRFDWDRRRWIVAEAQQPGTSFAAVARRYEVIPGLLWNWRQQVRRGELIADQRIAGDEA